MNELHAALNIALANTYIMYFKAHSYHWNVEGMFFSQFHDFFGDIYGELYAAVDPFAEELRAADAYAPVSLAMMQRYSTVKEDDIQPVNIRSMILSILDANNLTIESLNKAFSMAEQENKQGLMDFLATRIDAHTKHGWMLKASAKTTSGE